MPTDKPRLKLTLSERQYDALKRAAEAQHTEMAALVRDILATAIDDFPRDLLAQGEANQPEDRRIGVQFQLPDRVQIVDLPSRPKLHFGRLYNSDTRAAAYFIGDGWTQTGVASVTDMVRAALEMMPPKK